MIKLTLLIEGKLEQAEEFAKTSHSGQLRSTGEAYITHPKKVAKLCKKLGLGEVEQIVAWLHDTVEDSKNPAEIETQIKQMFGNKVLAFVKLLTHRRGDPYKEYVLILAKKSHKALNIKLCDMYVNLHDKPNPRQKIKYLKTLVYLEDNGIDIGPKFKKLFK